MRGFSKYIFFISMAVYVTLNLVENTIHYNIGRNFDIEHIRNIHFIPPSSIDFSRIISVMFVFAVLQGIFTVMLSNRFAPKRAMVS
jgi:hypothetical protein